MSSSDRKLVLIVDDTPTNVAVISGVLKDSFRTKVATNGEKALAIATAPEKPDLILLDVMMPGMDGYEVCRRLKDNPVTRDIPDHLPHRQDRRGRRGEGISTSAPSTTSTSRSRRRSCLPGSEPSSRCRRR